MKISGYTTSRNAIEMGYPIQECILSMLDFCDEVIVADSSDGTDGTLEFLEELMDIHDKLEVVHVDVDYTAPNHAIWDGKMKAVARAQCTGDYLWQQDLDEIVPPGQRQKIEYIASNTLANDTRIPVVALPVVEYWGSQGKVRVDVNPWKWRLSKNDPNVTHGIPIHLRKWEDGLLYAMPGTDTCDYIYKDSGKVAPCGQFMTNDVDVIRRAALNGDEKSLETYEAWFNKVANQLPTVYHFSWWSVAWKVRNYKKFWNKFWQSMYNEDRPEGYNPFFSQPLEEISDEQIKLYAKIIEENTGGHIFHKPWVYTQTPSVKINQPVPEIMKEWQAKHTQ